MRSYALAPAKVILTGEHFVVYGAAAIVAAVDIYSKAIVSRRNDKAIVVRSSSPRCTMSFIDGSPRVIRGGKDTRAILEPICHVTHAALEHFDGGERGLDIQIDSAIPVGVGLGSSAAVAVSTIAATAKLLRRRIDREAIRHLAFGSECMIHKAPSGIDQTTSTFGGVIMYRREKPFQRIPVKHTFPIIIGNTGKTRSTGTMVSKVRAFLKGRSALETRILRSAERVSMKALAALQCEDVRQLGELMNSNHGLLRQIEVSTRELDRLVSAARKAGAFGAKLTGAGGGGCMIAVAPAHRTATVIQAIRDEGGTPYLANIERKGVRSWLVR